MNKGNRAFQKFIVLWSGEFISAIGSGLTAFGLGVYVYRMTGKASAMAMVTLLAFLPPLLLSSFAGVLADRYDRRLMMILGDSLSVFGLIYILICMYRGEAKLWQVCLGVAVSAVFSSLMDPAYKATVTDLLSEDQYSRASGLVQITNSAKYLISPVVAGYLLTISDTKLILIIDISTFFVTVLTTLVVRKGLSAKSQNKERLGFAEEFRIGWRALVEKKGVILLVVVASALTFYMGFIQILSAPMILAFTGSSQLGTIETIIACGMLASSIFIGVVKLKSGYVKLLSISLFITGLMMVGFGWRENLPVIGIFGFLFFAALPFTNTCLDYLVRTNIANEVQGRAWSLIGVISQFGYVLAYASCGILADYVFTPMLIKGGSLTSSVGKIIGVGKGRGSAFLIIIAGILLSVTALGLYHIKAIRELENKEGGNYVLDADTQ